MHPWKREIIFQTIIFRCELLVSGRVQLPGKIFDASLENGVPANLETHGFLGSMLSFMGGRMLKPLWHDFEVSFVGAENFMAGHWL